MLALRAMSHRVLAFVSRHPAATVVALLGVVYAATLAPSVTLWDSGEFLSAIRTLGVPHPPGTPLFIFVARVWSMLLVPVDFTVAVNAGSALATAIGVAMLVRTFADSAGPLPVVLAGLVAGLTSSVWQSATETEVYGYALCLGAIAVRIGDHAGRHWSSRHRALLAFVLGLAVPLHISALVVGPAAILLSATDGGGSLSLRAALPPAAAWLVAAGLGTTSPPMILLGVAVAILAAALPVGGIGSSRREGFVAIMLATLGATFAVVMLVRAMHDPGVNQGNPDTWRGLLEVVGRAQYDVPPLWPRRAPAWLQVGNLVQYGDWQFALGLDASPGASFLRTPVTMAFVALGIRGAAAHHAADRRGFRGFVLLLLAASLGVVGILNLLAGPSYGYGILPEGALHEARERDYFFALAFVCWGIWSGLGIAALARQAPRPAGQFAVCAVAFVPMVLNWTAMTRRRSPDRVLSQALGIATLEAAPANAVIVLAGDNDTYATWWAQRVQRLRPDVLPVTVPLLPADWYRAELARRGGLLEPALVRSWHGTTATLQAIVAGADRAGRPVAAAVGLTR
ncbi:MAG: DUF2723 domain-containing protein, partial [Cytophagaceae bacterium]|nr:DUF2723 domain-containing protein [Gemmatimonadaceae bacterium]